LHNIKPQTLFTGQSVIYLPSCHSTNDYALDLLTSRPMEGTTIITSDQTAGRGQRGNSWETKPDQNLTFSIIWKPHFLSPSKQFDLNIAVSLGVADFVEQYLSKGQVWVKWPNDLYFKLPKPTSGQIPNQDLFLDKKLGGILIENQIQSHRIHYTVIGIGLNINQENFKNLQAISFSQITKKSYNLKVALEQLLEKLEGYYLQLHTKKSKVLKIKYLQKLYRYQERHWFRDVQGIFEGEIVGVTPEGKLAVLRDNRLRYYNFKEIVFL